MFWIISEKGKVLSWTKVQHLTSEEPIYPDVQYQIRDYHGSLEYELGSENFGTSLYGYDSFINNDKEGIPKGDPNKERYQGPTYYPVIYEIIDNSDEESEAKYYDQYIGDEVVLPNQKGEKLMRKVITEQNNLEN